MASATTDLVQLSAARHNRRLNATNYTAWRLRHMCVNNSSRVALDNATTWDLLVASPAPWPLGHRATQFAVTLEFSSCYWS